MNSDQKTALELHNSYRLKHGSAPLEWSEELAGSAKAWVEKLIKDKSLSESSKTGHGENIAHSKGYSMTGKLATDSWYSEMELYDFENPVYQPKCRHFTQMIWASSKKFGFAISHDDEGTQYAVARYYPPGNTNNQFLENVHSYGTPLQTASAIKVPAQKFDEIDFQKQTLIWVNKIRKRHGVPMLSLDPDLNVLAKNTAKFYLNMHHGHPISSDHSRTSYGRSVKIDEASSVPDPKMIIQSFYRGEELFDYAHGCFSWKTAAFTQMIWKSTTKLGVAVESQSHSNVTVLLYSSIGNIDGLYRMEVHPPISSIPNPFN